MVTNLSTPKYRCDICGTNFTGDAALKSAEACEGTGLTPPLPDGTWLLTNGYHHSHAGVIGGFRLVQIRGHEIRRAYTGENRGHTVMYRNILASDPDQSHVHPHQAGVLNVLSAFAHPSLHGDQLWTALAESPGAATEYVDMLAQFGASGTADRVAAVGRQAQHFGFGSSADGIARAAMLPPLASMTPAVQAAFLAIAAPAQFGGHSWVDRAGATRRASIGSTILTELRSDLVNVTQNWQRTRARALTFALHPVASLAERWFAGEDVHLPPDLLDSDGGTTYNRWNSRKLSIEQRDLLRALDFTVRWPPRVSNAAHGEISTPDAALRALTDRYTENWEHSVPDSTLFPAPHKIAVESGKGGVGKTTIAAATAYGLASRGHNTLLIDLDFHGPSVGTLLDLPPLTITGDTDTPVIHASPLRENLSAISVSQFVAPGTPITWRSASVEGFLLFLAARLDTASFEYIVFDFPPGTGDIEASTYKLAKPDGAILVTTGSKLSHADCARAAAFARHHSVPLLGVVENMSRTSVTVGGTSVEARLFGTEEGTVAFTESLAHDNGFGDKWTPPYLGSLPFEADPAALSMTPEFQAVIDAAETHQDHREDTGDPRVRHETIRFAVER